MPTAINLHLFKDLSPLQIVLLLVIKIYSISNVSPSVLIKIARLIEHKYTIKSDNQNLIVLSSLENLREYLNDDSCFSQLSQTLKLIQSIEDLDREMKEFKELATTKQKTNTKTFAPSSLFGAFIIQACTFYEQLEFHQIICLYQSLDRFRGVQHATLQGNGNLESVLDAQLAKLNANPSNEVHISSSKAYLDQLINEQVTILETLGTPTPPYLKEIMRLMSSTRGSIGKMVFNHVPNYYYYLQYLENLAELDYNGAVDSLHQYFDYMVSNNSKYFYHFALISKASLHQYFGEDQKAIDSIEAAVSVARENKDNATLTYILSWFCNFMHHKPYLWAHQSLFNKNSGDNLLDFIIKKSSTVSQSLLALNLGFETIHMMNNSQRVATYTSNLVKTLYVAVNDSKSTFSRSAAVASTVWSRLGIASLSDVYTDIALCYCENSSDRTTLEAKKLYRQFQKGINCGEMYLQISSLSPHDSSLQNVIRVQTLLMQIKLYLQQKRLRKAKEVMDLLVGSNIKDITLRSEVSFLEIEIDIEYANYKQALSKIEAMQDCDDYTLLRLSLLKCQIFNRSGTVPMSLLVQVMSLSDKFGFASLFIEATLLLLETLQKHGHKEEAEKYVDSVMPMAFTCGDENLIRLAQTIGKKGVYK
ncbi:hypothetical protein KGF57_002400 [Candida theae]|uniref:Anaphase-promoting complex subunit 5 n=1 Tax=Candida theae TaxID=1198502 RepID=A0AAD5FYS5_9ASCO|nr:uncharacterized protein KGF57_002400 [Candida theae]KAI5958555.1 hypothetical protein KGF57_002400 [Candida theae]